MQHIQMSKFREYMGNFCIRSGPHTKTMRARPRVTAKLPVSRPWFLDLDFAQTLRPLLANLLSPWQKLAASIILLEDAKCESAGLSIQYLRAAYDLEHGMKNRPEIFPLSMQSPYLQTMEPFAQQAIHTGLVFSSSLESVDHVGTKFRYGDHLKVVAKVLASSHLGLRCSQQHFFNEDVSS